MAYNQIKKFDATSAGFGQMGSVFVKSANSAVTSNGLTAFDEAVFCAITFLEDSTFADTNGLVAEKQQHFVNSDGVQDGISANTAQTNGQVFPKGVTIYGRWTKINLTTGNAIAYIGY